MALHRDLIDAFGGSHGIRDEGLLDSALAQPPAEFGGQLLHPTIELQAAAYLFHLCKNHPFIDGNKRIAFACMDTFLRLNGKRLTLDDEAAYRLALSVAEGSTSKEDAASIITASSEVL